jgi:hypothetical protein
MKKLVSLLFLLIFTLSLFNCSSDDIVEPIPVVVVPPVTPPVVVPPVVVPVIPASKIMRPAIRNINDLNKTGKSTVEYKKLVKSIVYGYYGSGPVKYYKLNDTLTQAKYENLPSDYIYDQTEEALNIDTYKINITDYLYNASNQLIQIKSVSYLSADGPSGVEKSTYYTYDVNGRVASALDSFGSIFTYNEEGLIVKRTQFDGKSIETFSYDIQKRVLSSTRYTLGPNDDAFASIETWDKSRTDYVYTDTMNNMSFAIWFTTFNKDGSVRNNNKQNEIKYDDSKPGVKNKEAFYMIDNSYVHNKDAKFFYDVEGYLRKIDKSSKNSLGAVTVFFYQ